MAAGIDSGGKLATEFSDFPMAESFLSQQWWPPLVSVDTQKPAGATLRPQTRRGVDQFGGGG
jgi:hypothetical protein